MKLYNLSYFLSPELKEEEVKKITEEITSFIEKEEGNIVKTESSRPKTLAYPIKKQTTAFFSSLDFYLDSQKLEELRKKLQKTEKILRFLLTSKLERRPEKVLVPTTKEEKPKTKVELKEIEKKLEEILGE